MMWILRLYLAWLYIKSINKVEYSGNVYNLNVQHDASYIVGGRAVHNCDFNLGVEGSYYAKYLVKMRLNNQIGNIPYESHYPVNTCWDIGVDDRLDDSIYLLVTVL